MVPLRWRIGSVAVIGTGALGKEHARLYATCTARGSSTASEFTIRTETAHRVAQHGYRVSLRWKRPLSDGRIEHRHPTVTHFDIAQRLLHRHVLVEKPMTDDATQAAELVRSISMAAFFR